MKAMVLTAPNQVALDDVAEPKTADGEIMVRVANTGICGTDLKIFQGGIPVQYPLIMGHETVGEVVAGEGRAGVRPGARVIVDPAYFCGVCYQCQAGQQNICPNGGLIGRDRDGGFADLVTAPVTNVYPLPEGIDDGDAPLIQVLTTCLHAHRLADIFPGEAVVVIGLGVTGQLHVQLAKARGAYPVIGITRSAWKRELAESLGADVTMAPDKATAEQVLQATGGRGADLVIESVGQLPVLAQAIELARVGGRVLPFGIHTAKDGALPFYDLYFKEIQIINARVAKGQDFPACIDLVRRGVVKLAPLISHTLPFAGLDRALDLLTTGRDRHMKVILDHAA